jgi:hypothetical protein
MHIRLHASGRDVKEIVSRDEYTALWRDTFGSPLADIGDLWPNVCAAHEEWARTRG